MPIPTITYNGKEYPAFQAEGNAARWIMPFAMKVCQPTGKEIGFDVGCNRPEWAMPGAVMVDPAIKCRLCESGVMHEHSDAYNLPKIVQGAEPYSADIISDSAISLGYKNIVYAEIDYIFSSHCLEHLPNWVQALDYWHSRLKSGGVVFLYLPAHTQEYWLPWNNRKHIHSFTPEIIEMYFKNHRQDGIQWRNAFVTGIDLNDSFCAIAEKV